MKEVELDSGVKTTESNVDITGAESGFEKDEKYIQGYDLVETDQEWKTVHRRRRKSHKEEEVTATGTKEDSRDIGCNVTEKVDWLKQTINKMKHTLKTTHTLNADIYTECMCGEIICDDLMSHTKCLGLNNSDKFDKSMLIELIHRLKFSYLGELLTTTTVKE